MRQLLCLFLLTGSALLAAEETAPTEHQRLAELIQVWGQVKFFHPTASGIDVDWDQALMEAAPLVQKAEDSASYAKAYEHLFSHLKDPRTQLEDGSQYSEEKDAYEDAFKPSVAKSEDGIMTISMPGIDLLGQQLAAGNRAALANLFDGVKEASGLVLDLRQARRLSNYRNLFFFDMQFKNILAGLSDSPIHLPSSKTRFHSGYNSGFGSGGYYSGAMITDHETLVGTGAFKPNGPVVIIFNELDSLVLSKLAGLQSSGKAWLICESDETPGLEAVQSIELHYGLTAQIRKSDTINVDGSQGFTPALHFEPGDGDEAMAAALKLIKGKLKPQVPTHRGSVAFAPAPEKPYADTTAPNQSLRLLALARYWNIIHYAFPYKHLLDQPWEKTLEELIPIFLEAEGEEAYGLAIARAAACMQDTHGSVRFKPFQRWLGESVPMVKVSRVEDRAVVAYCDPDLGLAPGDVILSVDGQTVTEREAVLKPYLAYSTPQAMYGSMSRYLLSGEKGSQLKVEVEGANGERRSVTLTRTHTVYDPIRTYRQKRSPGAFKLLDQGFGYMDLNYLTRGQVAEAFEMFKDTPGLIIDIRGYPKGTAWAMTPHLSEKDHRAASFSRPLAMDMNKDSRPVLAFFQRIPAGGKTLYQGKIAVLINEDAISQSEHTCLFLESTGADVTFIGTPTNGANGDVTIITLPGGARVNFTGHDVRHADGSQLQRKGIQPDLIAAPTVQGIRDGVDEVLEAGVRFLRENTSQSDGR